jgi:hypothetical protein
LRFALLQRGRSAFVVMASAAAAVALILPSCAGGDENSSATNMTSARPEHSRGAGADRHELKQPVASFDKGSVPKGFIQLRGAEIRKRIFDRRLMPDRAVTQLAPEFAEEFSADGTWVINYNSRANMIERGTWRIVEDQLCVAPNGGGTQCRHVWGHPDGRTALPILSNNLGIVLIMTASPRVIR